MYIYIFGILGPICFTQYGLGIGMQGGLVEVTPGYTIPVNPPTLFGRLLQNH